MCVGNCQDPFVTYLKSYGYNTIRLPRANIRPLQLLTKSGRDLAWLGDLTDVFVPKATPIPAPPIQYNVEAPNIQGQRTGSLSVGVTLSILGPVIGAMGGSKLGLDTAYKRANSARFEFTEVQSDMITTTKLDEFLGGSDINPNSVAVGQMLEASQVFVVTNTVKSKKFTIETAAQSGQSVGLDVPVIQQVVGAAIKVSADQAQASRITYEGSVPLIFGFQAVQIFYDSSGRYTMLKPLAPGGIAAMALQHVKDDGATRLVVDEEFVAAG